MAAPVPTPAEAAGVGQEDGDAMAKEDPSEVKAEENDEEDVLGAYRVQYYKLENNKWKGYAAGPLKLYRNKQDPANMRMVMRDTVGKVQLNLKVQKGMTFVRGDVKKGKGSVRFFATQDAERGPQQFLLKCRAENLDGLHISLTGMVE